MALPSIEFVLLWECDHDTKSTVLNSLKLEIQKVECLALVITVVSFYL